jgi:hypothetical protein
MGQIKYFLDGVDFSTYSVCVSESEGLLDIPARKKPFSQSWDDEHGEVVDLRKKYYEPREITLNCFIEANGEIDFITKLNTFLFLFDAADTRRLMIEFTGANKPLVYEVYLKDSVSIDKTWDSNLMVGTFKLKLVEPEPVKRVYKVVPTESGGVLVAAAEFTVSTKLFNVYWGDGSSDKDVSGTGSPTHTYSVAGTYYVIITGVLDNLTITPEDGTWTLIWSRL